MEFLSLRGSMAAYVASVFLHGGALIYGSQEVGYPEPINFFKYVPVDWNANPQTYAEYKQLIKIYNENPEVREGNIVPFPHKDVLAFERNLNADRMLVLVNLRDSTITIPTPQPWLNKEAVDLRTNFNDGQITDDDRYVYYKPDADVNIGLNTELSYQKWTLSASLRSSLGNYVYNNVQSDAEMKADMWTNNFIANRISSAPYTNFAQAQYKSDYYVQNASFLKLDRVTLAYNICDWARVHFTAQNIFTITNYKGVDPEVAGGIDNNMYPRSRNFLVGASFNF